MDRVLDVDPVSLTARVEPGLLGPELERLLGDAGLTLGHFPQSFEYSTVGGWVATRSAGQASTGIGRIDELVQAVRCETPAGALATLDVPATAAGPSLRELVVGSEGVLGVITEATLRVRPAPRGAPLRGVVVRSFAEGAEAYGALEQAGAHPDVAACPTRARRGCRWPWAPAAGRAERAGRAPTCACAATRTAACCHRLRGLRRRRGPPPRARSPRCCAPPAACPWASARALVARGASPRPYLRDELLDRGVMVETLETAPRGRTCGASTRRSERRSQDALTARGTPGR